VTSPLLVEHYTDFGCGCPPVLLRFSPADPEGMDDQAAHAHAAVHGGCPCLDEEGGEGA